jgi:transposase
MTPQKPVRRAFEQNNEDVKKWIKEEYPQIRCNAKREKARIYWGDEMGLRSDHATGRSFSLKGKTPVIYGTGQRFGCNMISAITNKGQLQFMVFKHRFNAQVFVGFLDRMKRQVPGKVFLIIDSHPAHRSGKVKNWTQVNKRFKIFFLPGYSPELNPDEMLNQDVKSNSVGRNRAHHQRELLGNVRGYLRSRQRQPEIVRNYFKEEHVQYAAV